MKPMRKTNLRTTVLAALAPVGLAGVMAMMIANVASAQPAGGPRQGPPAEALAACKSLASGADCEFSGPQGKASGTCFAPQQGMALACRPKDAPASDGTAPGPKQ